VPNIFVPFQPTFSFLDRISPVSQFHGNPVPAAMIHANKERTEERQTDRHVKGNRRFPRVFERA